MTRPPSMELMTLRLNLSRRELARCRRAAVAAAERSARAELLDALTAYVGELERRRLPVPPALQCELRTLRAADGR